LVASLISGARAFAPRRTPVLVGARRAVESSNPLESFFAQFVPKPAAPPGSEFDASIEASRDLLISAAATKTEDGQAVVDALLDLEKNMRAKAKVNPQVATETLAGLDGAWRLVFTTGTLDTQKKLKGRINYFPLKAVQCFDTEGMRLTNSIMVGDKPLIKFFGPFEFNLKSRKLEFDFTSISVLGFKFELPKGGAADIGSATGLGSDNNKELVEKGKKPFFNWISADGEIATARGGGGGLALWKRDLEQQERNVADPDAF